MNDDVTTPAKKGFPWGWLSLAITIVVLMLAFLVKVDREESTPAKRVTARNDAGNIRSSVLQYIVEFNALPVGDQAQIMAALLGKNPQQIVFWEFDTKRFNARGEFLDPWGSAYRIDTSDPKSPRVYSFGKNRIDEGGAEGSDDVVSWR